LPKDAENKKTAPLLSAYLLLGDDKLKREHAQKRMEERIAKLGDLSMNSQVIDSTSSDVANTVLNALNTLPFASSLRLVSLLNVDKAPKALIDSLVDYLKSPASTSVLVMSADKLARNSRLFKAVSAVGTHAVVDCSSKKANDVIRLVQGMAASYASKLDSDVARHLVSLIGPSTVALDAEVKKLAAYVQAQGRSFISHDDVSAIVTRTSEATVWEFLDTFMQRDIAATLRMLHKMSDKETPYSMLPRCMMRLRDLMTIKALKARGTRNIAQAMSKQDWQIRKELQAAANFSMNELESAFIDAAVADKKMKSGSDPNVVFSTWLANVM
jgi:DNA polymerase-3 subunit delta